MTEMSHVMAAGYLAGMIDGEGYVTLKHPRKVSITNTDFELIEAVTAAYDLLGVRYHVYRRGPAEHKSEVWDVVVANQEGLRTILHEVPFASTRKRERLETIIASFKWERRRLDEDLPPDLRERYEAGESCIALGKAFGVAKETIRRWLVYLDVPRRPAPGR